MRLLLFLLPVLCCAQYDILVTNARVVDGTGAPWFRGSIAIRAGKIERMGHLPGATASVVLDASGLVAAPGFIDIHNHSRRAILQVPAAENMIRQGVTTVVEGNDGSSPVPLAPFLDKLRAAKIAVNFATLVGQGSVREKVIGTANRNATPDEIGKMQELVREAMRDGAWGLSTGLFYVPGNFTPVEEVIALAKVAGSLGGIHISHMREETSQVLDSVRETIRIGEEGGLPTQVTHHKIMGHRNWGASAATLREVEQARARGVDVTIDQYPYTASSTGTAALFPQWSLSGGAKALAERLGAPEQRRKIHDGIVHRILYDRGGGDPKNVVLAHCAWDAKLDGKSLADIARGRGLAPTPDNAADIAIEIQSKGGCSAVYHAIGEEDVERILRHPLTMIASDGGIVPFGEGVPHPRNYGTFARVLGRYVRERQTLGLEEAIRKMTSYPAARLGAADRGVLRAGMMADIVLFDPATVRDRAEFGKPHQYAEGFRHVLVNGILVLRDGKMTGERSGRVLAGPAAISPR